MSDDHEPQAPDGFLDTLPGEIALFRSIERARPVGMHKHFHMLTLRRSIRNESGVWVDVGDIWAKLATLYHLDALDDMDDQQFDPATGRIILYPGAADPALLHTHPYFREFALPYAQFNDMMSTRRAASPGGDNESAKLRKRNLNAGLTNDDSDLSDLTEGEDDAETDAATEPADDAGEEEADPETPEDTTTSRRGSRKSISRTKPPTNLKGSRGKTTGKKKKAGNSIDRGAHDLIDFLEIDYLYASYRSQYTVALLPTLLAEMKPCIRVPEGHAKETMIDIPNVPCTLVKPDDKLLTMRNGEDGMPLSLEEATGTPGEQEWRIEQRSEDTIVLRNLRHDKYAGIMGETEGMPSVVVVRDPFEFKVEEASGRHCYKLYLEPRSGERLYMDFSMLRSFPPQCAMLPGTFVGKPWSFQFSG